MSRLPRRAALLLPLGAAGCSAFDNLFDTAKVPLRGKREPVTPVRRGLEIPPGQAGIAAVPLPTPLPDWAQAGCNAVHAPGHPAAPGQLRPTWTANVGEGTEYRQRMTSTPVVAGGRVIAMDADGTVSAFDFATGARLWRTRTRPKGNRSTNVGGGVAASDTRVWATTGRSEALALDAASGNVIWRQPLGAPARCAPTIADGRLFVTTLDNRLLVFATDSGAPGWTYQAGTKGQTTLLAASSPAVAEGFVVAGFGSADLVTVRADTGAFAWTDNLASAAASTTLADLSAISGLPVIDQGRVYVIGDGGLFVCNDLRSGRRLWERDVGGSQTPWLAGDVLYVVTQQQVLAALDARDGHPIWVYDLPRYRDAKAQTGPVRWVGPLMAGNRLIVASSTSRLAVFQPATGRLLAAFHTPNAVSLPLVTANGTVLVLDDEGMIRAFR